VPHTHPSATGKVTSSGTKKRKIDAALPQSLEELEKALCGWDAQEIAIDYRETRGRS
jgi:hypothetical protein